MYNYHVFDSFTRGEWKFDSNVEQNVKMNVVNYNANSLDGYFSLIDHNNICRFIGIYGNSNHSKKTRYLIYDYQSL